MEITNNNEHLSEELLFTGEKLSNNEYEDWRACADQI